MSSILILGGARSGKSRLAEDLVEMVPGSVTLIATAEAGDEEMRLRIIAHREARPSDWSVVEEPLGLLDALETASPAETVIIDCLTLWVSNLIGDGLEDGEIEARASAAAKHAASRAGMTVVVSNEVGSGLVPVNALARRYRDLLGRVNSTWADLSEQVYLTVAGGVVPVQRLATLWGDHDG
ncbi:MAG: bifunctional adenosylcobinamide kinase/adenosylcobinamide-phosphate guanylyltransferase [Acidimicrobiia bacterium]